jgi:hypothetical protein
MLQLEEHVKELRRLRLNIEEEKPFVYLPGQLMKSSLSRTFRQCDVS